MRYSARMARCRRPALVGVGGLLAVALFLLAPFGGPPAAQAATISTPYVSMTVQAGQTVTLPLTVTDTVAERADVSVQGVPEEWTASVLGGGRPVSAVITSIDPDNPLSLTLQVEIPADAAEGTSTLTVVLRSGGVSSSLPITMTVSKVEGGTTGLTAEYASLRGAADDSYTFSLTLDNNTLDARTYNLSATGPEGWSLSLKPSGATQETPTVTVESQGSQRLTLTVTPALDAEIGTHDLSVTATGGGETVSVPLTVDITGTYTLSLTTADGSLNTEVKAGSTTKVQFLVTNKGTGALQNIQLSASPPTGWTIDFEPATIDSLDANMQQPVTAVFKPGDNAVAGDYMVTMSAKADLASASANIRVTVKTSTLWGVIGVVIAVAVIVILGLVFWRYGHR